MLNKLLPSSIVIAILLAAAAATESYGAEARWIRLHSQNFELYTSAGERNARDTLREFERVRSFFLQAFKRPVAGGQPVRLVAFRSAKEYEPYRPNEFATAFYQEVADRDYIIMSHGGADTFPVAVHEYVHLLVRHSNLKLPPWLNEGLAELYSTIKPMGDKVLLGDLIRGRHRALLEEKWVPLEVILAADHRSPYYNEKNKAGSLYNEGWALTHMLSFREEYSPKFSQLVAVIHSGVPSAQAITQVYGRPVEKVDKDLQGYLRGTSFRGALVTAKLEKSTEELAIEALPDFDLQLIFADLSSGAGKDAAVRAKLEELVKQDPKRPEPYSGLGYLAWKAGKTEEAASLLGKAYERGDRSPRLLWDYGRLAERQKPAEAVQALSELVKLDPDRVEARLELAEMQLRGGHAALAIATIQPIHKITPAEASRYFRIAVYAYLRGGDEARAKETAEKFKAAATTEEQRETAELLLSQIKIREAKLPELPRETAVGGPPVLRRGEEVRARPEDPVAPPPPAVSGRFVALECGEGRASMVIEVDGAKQVFLIEDPGKIAIKTGGRGTVDLECGRQKEPAMVRVEYAPSGQAGIKGVVKTLAFE